MIKIKSYKYCKFWKIRELKSYKLIYKTNLIRVIN